MSHYGFEATTRRRLEANEDDDGGMTSARQGLSDLNGPERTPYIGLDKMLHQALRLDGSESDAGGDGASMESSSPVPPASVPIPTRPGLTRVQSSFTSYSSRSPASRTTSVTSLYDSLGSSAPRTNSAESVPRQSTLKTQMLPPGRPTTTATAQPEDRPRPYPSRSTSSSSDAHYLPYPPSYPVTEPVHHLGPSGAPYHPQRLHPHLYPAPVHSGYVAAPNTPAYVPTPGATPQHLYHPGPYGAGQPYYSLHPGQPYIFGQPVYGGQPAGLVATADGQYMQLVASQPYGPISGPTHAPVYAQPAYVPPMAASERTLAERFSFGPPRPQRQPSGYAGSEASSPSSYQPGYHLPNLSPHLLDHHFVTYSPPSTETSPGTGPVSPFDASATNVPYPISASRSSSSEQIIEQQRRRLSGAHRDDGQTLSPVGREPGPEDPAFAQRNFARPSASVRPLEGDPRSRSDVEGGPDAMERRYATRVGYPAPALPPPVVAGGAHGPGTSTSGRGGQQGPASASGRPGWSGSRAGGGGRARKDLPQPPTHSLHALWVGNVPSDASHAELWQFFQTRPTPKECGMVATPGDETADLDSNGVESIHLITRSNCAFVNYATNLHLHHSIAVTNGVPLRPEDPRSKPLVCRVRKAEDDSKSGVGAQRMGGMHMAFVRAQQVKMQQEQRALREKSPTSISEQGLSPPQGMSDKRRKSTVSVNSAGTSIGSTSTTSSFLAKHFERRYFILKSHGMADLQKSVETGMWATQPHNEPVLQQAFRTARSVYLLFGANGAGSWFGYARMAGPISNSGGGSSSHSTRSHGSSAGARSATSADQRFTYPGGETIVEESEAGASSSEVEPPAPHLFSPSENRWLDVSPLGITPTTTASPGSTLGEHTGGSAPATLAAVPAEARRAMSLEQERMALETAGRLHLPPDVTQDARKTVSYDPRPREPSPPASPQGELRIKTEDTDEGLLASGEQKPEEDAFVSAVEARNAHLDKIESARSRANTATADKRSPPKAVKTEGASTPFAIEWIVIRTLPFSRTRHVRNSFNGNREVKISRDGTEIEPTAGELVLNEFWRRDPSSRTEVPMRPSSPQPLWHGSGHSGARTPSRNEAGLEDDEDKTPPGRPSSTGAPARASEPPPKSPAVVSPYEGRSETV